MRILTIVLSLFAMVSGIALIVFLVPGLADQVFGSSPFDQLTFLVALVSIIGVPRLAYWLFFTKPRLSVMLDENSALHRQLLELEERAAALAAAISDGQRRRVDECPSCLLESIRNDAKGQQSSALVSKWRGLRSALNTNFASSEIDKWVSALNATSPVRQCRDIAAECE